VGDFIRLAGGASVESGQRKDDAPDRGYCTDRGSVWDSDSHCQHCVRTIAMLQETVIESVRVILIQDPKADL